MKFKLFKTDAEKLLELQKKLEDLNAKYKQYEFSFCMYGTYVFVFKGFDIIDNRLVIKISDKNTPEDYFNYDDFWKWELKYNGDIQIARENFINFKHQLKCLNLEINKIK